MTKRHAPKRGFHLGQDPEVPYVEDHVVNQDRSRMSSFTLTLVSKRVKDKVNVDGWDLIVPAERARSVWKALVFSGARAIGWEARKALNTELGVANFPQDYPDTNSGALFWHEASAEAETRYFAKPKAKRIPYQTTSPFCPDWKSLLFPEKQELEPFCVLRGDQFLQAFPFDRRSSNSSVVRVSLPTLVQVVLHLPRRGIPQVNAMICVPTATHYENWQHTSSWNGEAMEQGHPASIIGYVTSVTLRSRIAFGLCHCEMIQQLYIQDSCVAGLAMLRNPASPHYRPCWLKVIG